MRSHIINTTAISLIGLVSHTSAHGYVSEIVVGDKNYPGNTPDWVDSTVRHPSDRPAWYAFNQDAGYVNSAAYSNHAIICHKGAIPGSVSIPIRAGSKIVFKWLNWPQQHPGPILDYMAKCTGDCTDALSSDLAFFKIAEDGLHNGTLPANGLPGEWATNQLFGALSDAGRSLDANEVKEENLSWNIVIPSNIEPGHYVLRHEAISLHEGWLLGGAQNYPMCANLEVTSSGDTDPCSAGADCRKGTDLYNANDPGILINIFDEQSNYTIPGPSVWSGLIIPEIPKTRVIGAAKDPTLFGQCGGERYSGSTKCPEGTSCKYLNRYAWYCAP